MNINENILIKNSCKYIIYIFYYQIDTYLFINDLKII